MPDVVSLALKSKVCDSFIAISANLEVSETEIQGWMCLQVGVAVAVKLLNGILFLVKPISGAKFQRLLQTRLSSQDRPYVGWIDGER